MSLDFELPQAVQLITGLADEILRDFATPTRLAEVERVHQGFDGDLWRALAGANLLGVLGVAEGTEGEFQGGMVPACALLQRVGYHGARVPVWPALISAAAIVTFGTPEQRTALLPGLLRGDDVLTVALAGVGPDQRPRPVRATPTATRWLLGGAASFVPAARHARAILVPAETNGGDVRLFVVLPDAPGVQLAERVTTSGDVEGEITLGDVEIPLTRCLALGGDGSQGLAWLVRRARLCQSALMVGISQRAIDLAATYLTTRHQFGRPLASFQSVQHRLADAFIDLQAMRWTLWRAARSLDQDGVGEGEGEGEEEVGVAAYWAAAAGARILTATLHLHGGMGVDRGYPLHRFFLWAKQLELTIGSPTRHAAHLGSLTLGPA
jgi:alkylation response protein AidB-like acyl-CoA dehydrogenase